MDFTPWDFLNNFSSLLNFNAVWSTSNSKGESGGLIGALDSWGKIGGGAGPVGMSVPSWTFGISPGIGSTGGGELDAKQMLRFAVAIW